MLFGAKPPPVHGPFRLDPCDGERVTSTASVSYAPSRPQGGAELLGAVLALALVLPAAPLGRLLLVPVALALLTLGVRDLLMVPTLRADSDGVTVATGTGHRTYPWKDVSGVRVITDRRTPLLELDLDLTVVVLSRRRLGTAPYLVLEELDALRP